MNDGEDSDVAGATMPLGDHIEELRSRLLKCILGALAVLVLAWFFRHAIMHVLTRPHAHAMAAFRLDPSLKFRTYMEPIAAQLKACLVAALVVTSPFLLYQMWAFVAPGLFQTERRLVARLGLASLVCFAAGVGFGYFLFIPLALRFLLALSGPGIEPVLMIGSYLSLLFLLTVALGVVFQTPVIMYYLVRWGVVSIEAVQQHRKTAILTGFVLAAFLTPPDPFTQIMMAVPLVVLYDLGALVAAPGRRTLLNFGRFAGTVTLILAVVGAFFFLWPVGRITATKGTVEIGRRTLPSGGTASLRRGQVCIVAPDGSARVQFGRKASSPSLVVAGGTSIQVHGARAVSVHTGGVLALKAPGRGPIEVRALPGVATLRAGRAEFLVPELYTLTVNVMEGEATVRVEGRTTHVFAGRTATFQRGGQPLKVGEVGEVEERWRDSIE